MEKLTSMGFNSLRAVALIRDHDIVLLQLDTLGQARLLEHAVAKLQSQAEVASSTGPVQEDVIDAAAGWVDNPVGNLPELLGGLKTAETPVITHHKSPEQDPRLFLQGSNSNGESLRIVDYLCLSSTKTPVMKRCTVRMRMVPSSSSEK